MSLGCLQVAGVLLHTLKQQVDGVSAGFAPLKVTSVSSSETRRVRPQAMNTISLLKLASSVLGIGPQAAMRAAEHLYLSGFVSYPRTESTAYPSVGCHTGMTHVLFLTFSIWF